MKKRTKTPIATSTEGRVRLMHYSDKGFVVEFHFVKPAFFITLEELEKSMKKFNQEIKYFKK